GVARLHALVRRVNPADELVSRGVAAVPQRGGVAVEEALTNSLRKLRFEHGEMTQQDLAEHAGVTRQTIIALEAGKYAPSLLLALRIAHVFDVSVEEVFHLDANGRAKKPS